MEEYITKIRSGLREADTAVSSLVSGFSTDITSLENILGEIRGGLGSLPYAGTATESQVIATRRIIEDALRRGQELLLRMKTTALR